MRGYGVRQGVLRALVVFLLMLACWLVVRRDSPGWEAASGRPRRSLGAIYPRVSANGEAIVLSYQGAIWRVERNGGVMRRLSREAGFDVVPAWSPDQKVVAYQNSTTGELRWLDADRGKVLPIPRQVLVGGKLYFHPEANRLLGNFRLSQGRDQDYLLAWLDLQSGALQSILEPPRNVPVYCLSPDGRQIGFITTQDVSGEQSGHNGPQADVWMVPSTGGEPRKLTQFRSRIFEVWWGADELFFSSDFGGAHNDLWAMPIESPARARRLTSGQADEDSPSLSADGRWLVYTDNRESATAVMVRDLNSGEEQAVTVSGFDYGQPTGGLRISIHDKATGQPLTARLSVQQIEGKYFAPPGALYRIHGQLEHFYASQQAELDVPAGTYRLQAFHGLEYRTFRQEFEVEANRQTKVEVSLRRWTEPTARSWYSGESHIHANYGYGHWYNTPETMRLQLEGEGLNVANFMVANSDTDGVFDREFFRGGPDPLSGAQHILYWNEEFRATLWGHMTLLDLKYLVEPVFTGFKDTTNPWDSPTNADIADQTHLQGGHVNYTHPANNLQDPFLSAYSAKALPVDVALSKIDTLDINWGQATINLWYRLLNCGFRLPASAGTDCFLNRIRSRLPGSDRVYVKIDGSFSYRDWIENLRAGRSFVTNGPMLEFSAGGQTLGQTIQRTRPAEVTIKASVDSQFPLERAEVVYNGQVVAPATLSTDQLRATLEVPVRLERSGWLSFRAYDRDQHQAHTSPIYVEIAGAPTVSEADALYFLSWIDRLEAKLNERGRVPSPALKSRIERQLNAARDVYRKIASPKG
ncbi:MAG: CehA/McbA family metallohydrolase [Acidobacteriota bacterium]